MFRHFDATSRTFHIWTHISNTALASFKPISRRLLDAFHYIILSLFIMSVKENNTSSEETRYRLQLRWTRLRTTCDAVFCGTRRDSLRKSKVITVTFKLHLVQYRFWKYHQFPGDTFNRVTSRGVQ